MLRNNPGPFSRLHLVDSVDNNVTTYAQDFGYRPWMRNGITMTGNADQMYIRHKYAYKDSVDHTSGEINDRSDAVIEWSDNPDDAPWGTDRMRLMMVVLEPSPCGRNADRNFQQMTSTVEYSATFNS